MVEKDLRSIRGDFDIKKATQKSRNVAEASKVRDSGGEGAGPLNLSVIKKG